MLQRTVWCADPSRLTIDHCPRDSLLLLAGPMTPSFLSFAPSSSCWWCWFLCADVAPQFPPLWLRSAGLSTSFSNSFTSLVGFDAYVAAVNEVGVGVVDHISCFHYLLFIYTERCCPEKQKSALLLAVTERYCPEWNGWIMTCSISLHQWAIPKRSILKCN